MTTDETQKVSESAKETVFIQSILEFEFPAKIGLFYDIWVILQ